MTADMSATQARFMHVDMDAFYVEVERQRDPGLVGLPVVVGGTSDRGVVASASYEARSFGVRSAMPTARARKLCPEAIFMRGDFARYGEYSRGVHEIFRSITPVVEPIALDEAFLDISGAELIHGSPETIAHLVRERIHTALGLKCSVGVAWKKFISKLASEAAKPKADRDGVSPGSGVRIVDSVEELEFLHAHPVRALWGVGPATLAKLHGLGVRTVGDLAAVPLDGLVASLGRASGAQLHRLALGIDDRGVEVDRVTKSIGHEETFATDIDDRTRLESELAGLADSVAARCRAQLVVARTVTVKVKFADFRLITRSITLQRGIDTGPALVLIGRELLDKVEMGLGVRLLGLSVSGLGGEDPEQLTFDDLGDQDSITSADQQWREVSEAVDEIRARYGFGAIGPGTKTLVDRRPRSGRDPSIGRS